ncbi:MAG TPA: FAD-dependent oxidoreductase, partial [Patescibacteria group bacterium]|nr:FAD-dependent oxidoreductase [Patescibacteria group bacterium]
ERSDNRFFSIASAPFENIIRLTTKFAQNESSTFKKNLFRLKVGQSIEAFGPSGSFTLEDVNKQYVFIAGGIGITPFHSIISDLNHRNQPVNIILLYAHRTGEPLFSQELNEIAQNHPEFKIYYLISDEPVNEEQLTPNIKILPGKMNKPMIQSLIFNLQSPIYYISGPEPMMMAFEDMLRKMGIPKENIKRDYFPGYENF